MDSEFGETASICVNVLIASFAFFLSVQQLKGLDESQADF